MRRRRLVDPGRRAPRRPALYVAFVLCLVAGMVAAQMPASARAGQAQPPDEEEPLAGSVVEPAVLAELADEDVVQVVVEYTAKPNLQPAYQIDDADRRAEFVTEALRMTAEQSQREAIELVRDHPDASAESFWLRNVLFVEADRELVEAIAELDGVSKIRLERTFDLVEPEPGTQQAVAQADPEWGVAQIGADQVWEQGVLGEGVVVASIDTGVEFTHPALVEQYRGNQGGGSFDHNYNWWDPSNVCASPEPCDNIFHGTHTMGTIVGGDGPGDFSPDIGVAPGARWMTAKGCEDDGCSEGALLSSGQWVVEPTDLNGENPDPSMRPHIVSNSWAAFPGDPFYLDVVQAWRAAGIVPVFAAGNFGPECGSGDSPGDYVESISAGATDMEDVIADFSGRGPSAFGKINPDVTAPGVDVTSSVPGGGYEAFQGTSMATPHVAGTFALMLAAEPDLVGDVDRAADILRTTALDIIDTSCGGDPSGDPNNVYGDGRIDALNAVNVAATGGTLEGTVTDSASGDPIEGAMVTAANEVGEFSTTTDAEGHYDLALGAGTYTVTVEAFGYEVASAEGVEVITDQTTLQDVPLTLLPTFTVSGRITRAEDGRAVEGATVAAVDTPVDPVVTDRRGRYSLTLPQGTYALTASLAGCTNPSSAEVEVVADTTQDLQLSRKIDDFGHGCRPIPQRWVDAEQQTALFGDDVYGRLNLPFEFPFYNETYSQVFVTSNGVLSFVDPLFAEFVPSEIPSDALPNAAVYPLWTDLVIDEEAHVDYEDRGRFFVIEFENLMRFGGDDRVDFEVKLWSDGRIDMLYGDNEGAPGDGSTATIGLENADGTDALQFSFQEPVLQPGQAFRYDVVPTGVVSGQVVNANDGEPVAGATVTAQPGGRQAVTAEDGSYSLRLVPGSYELTATAENYGEDATPLTLGSGQARRADFSLPAARAEVSPSSVDASTSPGTPVTETVTVANTGSAPLSFDVRERDQTSSTSALAPVEPNPAVTRPAEWGRFDLPEDTRLPDTVEPSDHIPLESIIDDPDDDAVGSVEATEVHGGSDAETAISLAIDYSAGTPMGEVGGYVFLDTDQDESTGLPAEDLFGLPTQDVGMEYFVDIFGAAFGEALVFDQNFEFVASLPASIEGQRLTFDVPLDVLGADDGSVNTAMVLGDQFQPTDWAPDEGHGTIEPFRDAPWMAAEPTTGTVAPGESVELTLTLGGEGIDAGAYSGQLILLANDPRQGRHQVEVTLQVG